jgi:hypothetical protein
MPETLSEGAVVDAAAALYAVEELASTVASLLNRTEAAVIGDVLYAHAATLIESVADNEEDAQRLKDAAERRGAALAVIWLENAAEGIERRLADLRGGRDAG